MKGPILTLSMMVVAISVATTQEESGRGRHSHLEVVPVPGPVTLDGRLDDWDLSAQIEMFVVEATREQQRARFALMYDEQALYVSGDVRDASPLANRHDPRTHPQQGWNADSCQFRLTLDPDAPYPVVGESVFKYRGKNRPPDTQDDIVHLTLWYHTDSEQAVLTLHRGMTYRPEPGTVGGVLSAGQFQARYRKHDDGGGYTFEYRIPWSTLRPKRPLRAGDVVAGTVQFNWSRPDGLATAGEQAWAYDILREPGFPYQNPGCWGRLIFAPAGRLPARQVPRSDVAARPAPLEFEYHLPEAAFVTIQLLNEKNEHVRFLVAQQPRSAGRNVESWDGCDDRGQLLAAGTYRWEGVCYSNLEAAYRLSLHNSGQPPYPTADGRGGWGGDHGLPQTVCAWEGGLLMGWNSSEYGWGIIRTDGEGRKIWGSNYNATYLATDGERAFAAGGHGFTKHKGIVILRLDDSQPQALGGRNLLELPADATETTAEVTGLACDGQVLYASYAGRNQIARFDTRSGALLGTWSVPAPGRLAVVPPDRLAVISEGKVLILRAGQIVQTLDQFIAEPVSVAASAGRLFVANRGPRMNVSVFDLQGQYLHSVGKNGGRPPMGAYDPAGMYLPGGIAVDNQGRLWVAEVADFPKRISVWNAQTGEFLREFFGGSAYFAHGALDPQRPNEILAHNVLWEVDWNSGRVTPKSTIWRKTAPDMMPHPQPDAHVGNARLLTASNGRQYLFARSRARSCTLFVREGDIFRPFLARLQVGNPRLGPTEIPFLDEDRQRFPPGQYLWQDANQDGCLQPQEITALRHRAAARLQIAALEPDLTIRWDDGSVLRPTQILGGIPRYDIGRWETTSLRGGWSMLPMPGGWVVYSPGARGELAGWTESGERLWSYPQLPSWDQSLNMPVAGPGRLWGLTRCMGVAGEFIAFQTYFGPNHIFRSDGRYIGAVLPDRRVLVSRGPYEGQPEGQGGYFARLRIHGQDRYFLIGGGQDVRLWEVQGLETVRPLDGGVYSHSPQAAEKAARALQTYRLALSEEGPLLIATNFASAAFVSRVLDDGLGFRARLARDATHLLLEYEITSPAPLVNSVPDPRLLFRGGNCLDIQLENSRGEPVRALLTRRAGQPLAVLYFPKLREPSGDPVVLESPTGRESFDRIVMLNDVELHTEPMANGMRVRAALPLAALGLELTPGQRLRMDLGYIFGNEQGSGKAVRRGYVFNRSFASQIVDDIPHESRLEPHQWGEAKVE